MTQPIPPIGRTHIELDYDVIRNMKRYHSNSRVDCSFIESFNETIKMALPAFEGEVFGLVTSGHKTKVKPTLVQEYMATRIAEMIWANYGVKDFDMLQSEIVKVIQEVED